MGCKERKDFVKLRVISIHSSYMHRRHRQRQGFKGAANNIATTVSDRGSPRSDCRSTLSPFTNSSVRHLDIHCAVDYPGVYHGQQWLQACSPSPVLERGLDNQGDIGGRQKSHRVEQDVESLLGKLLFNDELGLSVRCVIDTFIDIVPRQ